MSYEDYAGLYATGHESKEPIKPEDEFFHSVYIAGVQRKNHVGIEEQIGKLQVRGVEYNKGTVCMIITHTKQVLAKIARNQQGKETVECFSYQEGGPPWKGTSGRQCGINSAERAAVDFCNACRAQMIVAGILCDESGKPALTEENKPTFIFVRGKGMKYSGVAEYLNEMSKLELEPLFEPPTEESKKFEKAVVNNKRHVTCITVGQANSQYGVKNVFELAKGAAIPKQNVMEILKIAKQTLEKFNEKMDWSKGAAGSGYGQAAAPEGSQIPDNQPTEQANTGGQSEAPTQETQEKKQEPAAQSQEAPFSFEDLSF